MPTFSVNHIFNEFIELNFHNYCWVYTDDSVSTNLAGFSFFIPERMVKYFDTLPHITCSFTAECYTISTALEYIKSLNITKCFIVSDSQTALSAFNSISISAATSPLILNIKLPLFELYSQDIIIELLWIPSHYRISVNKVADLLATSAKYSLNPSVRKMPSSHILNILQTNYKQAWQDRWLSIAPVLLSGIDP
jgi:ribonuclease HI